jgi:sigma-B regulation protein RsbU (phosphoserine phosphatase)
MAAMPPVKVGVILLISYAAALVSRTTLVKRIVLPAVEVTQPKRQFILDLSLSLMAGILASTYNMLVMGFPISSIFSLLVGCLMIGFFISLDTALAREREIILKTLELNKAQKPPRRLYSMTRKFFMAALTSVLFFSIVLVLVFTRDIVWLTKIDPTTTSLVGAQMSVAYEVFFIMVVMLILVINLIISYSKNLKILFSNETGVLERVSQGDLTGKVPIATNDEFGVIAGHTNNMIDGLRHRMQLINELKLAEEIQQNLLPKNPPDHPLLDISGTSLYCDEIGGDYYDFLNLPEQKLGIVVADAAGHGIGAAMHMTAARAFLHLSAQAYQGPSLLLEQVNRYVTRDSGATSRFLSMFFLEVDAKSQKLRWIRAGHEPAILFDPKDNKFEELSGEGMALGIVEDYEFQSYQRHGWVPGSILVIGTDGIHESRNREDAMFGQARVREIIQKNSQASAEVIQNAVIDALQAFKGDVPQEDDVTLVVIKLL